MNLSLELGKIRNLISFSILIDEVRRNAFAISKDFVVTDGCHHPMGSGCDVVVSGSNDKCDVLSRRIRGSIEDVNIKKIADGVLGLRASRRAR